MCSDRKARISGLAGNEHARNRTLPDLPSVWPWRSGYEINYKILIKRPLIAEQNNMQDNPF